MYATIIIQAQINFLYGKLFVHVFSVDDSVKVEPKVEVKQEKLTPDKQGDSTLKPPPDKKPKLR